MVIKLQPESVECTERRGSVTAGEQDDDVPEKPKSERGSIYRFSAILMLIAQPNSAASTGHLLQPPSVTDVGLPCNFQADSFGTNHRQRGKLWSSSLVPPATS